MTVTGDEIPEESILLERLQEALQRGTNHVNIINGYVVDTDRSVRLTFGPVLGEITANNAIVMIEVTGKTDVIPITLKLYKEDEKADPVDVKEEEVPAQRPVVFQFADLEPDTEYTVMVNGVSKYNATHRFARFKTKSENPTSFRLLALSCDRPSRLLLGQNNPWLHMCKRLNPDHRQNVDAVLHLGDQIYPDNEDIAAADKIFSDTFDGLSEDKQDCMMQRGYELFREKYRNVFSLEGKVDIVSKVSNLMIWSDNDVANDFTTMKNEEGSQKYHQNFLQCGMKTYREYQRRLWDPESSPDLDEEVAEWHSHVYGSIGIFMFDLRGNRISGDGTQMSENPLLSDTQWADLEEFFQNPELRAIILCSETPFVGDEPSVCKQKVEENPQMDFLRDHWPFNEDELVRLLDMCFSWKAEGEENGVGRDVLLVGGDIHCGVTSVIRDEETGMQINHLTASPVTNHVTPFFPPLSGNVSDRYNFSHLPLGQQFRNYADISVEIGDDDVYIQAKLVPISTDIFKDITWITSSVDED